MSERLLDNRIALVTGAASGIGRSIAERLAMSGATIIVTDIDEKAASSVARNLGPDAWSARLDVRSRPHTDALVEAIALRHGRLDILVNNAGLVRDAAVHKMSDEEWDDVDAVILRGAFALTRRIEAEIPIGRGGRPQDVAALVGFLASSDADYITGQVIEVHGGLEILKVQAP